MGTGTWRKARIVLALHACASSPKEDQVPPDQDCDIIRPSSETTSSFKTNSVSVSSSVALAPSRSPSRLQQLFRSRNSRSTCSICLEAIKAGNGHALFTAECSHTFHFSCIASSVKYGNLACPVCRASWTEVPFQAPIDQRREPRAQGMRTRRIQPSAPRPFLHGSHQSNTPEAVEEVRRLDPILRILDESIASARGTRHSHPPEPSNFDDDEPLDLGGSQQTSSDFRASGWGRDVQEISSTDMENLKRVEAQTRGGRDVERAGRLELKCYAETSSVAYSKSCESFTVLVHLKAAAINRKQTLLPNEITATEVLEREDTAKQIRQLDGINVQKGDEVAGVQSPSLLFSSRAPLDLVTVLDVSGSMAGTKLALLKRAMAFVVQNLSPSDRLSVVSFSSTARRLFPLRRMVPEGHQAAMEAIDALIATGGTNIVEGLKKGTNVLKNRRERNPVASIMLLSDGQDTCRVNARSRSPWNGDTNSQGSANGSLTHDQVQIPVHAFGFGADHDAATLHSIAESSGGTFSFIQTEIAVQDAFAQCIGGLLSVVAEDVNLSISTHMKSIQLQSIQSGSYESSIKNHGETGTVKLGYLYAEEGRDILFELKIPALEHPPGGSGGKMQMLKVNCTYKDPMSQRLCCTIPQELSISRPDQADQEEPQVSIEVDRQRNRLHIAHTIQEAQRLADAADIEGAQILLRNAKLALRRSVAFQSGDELSKALEAELFEIQVRMANRQMYEQFGRAYALSAQSSHSRQRATTRGDNTDTHSRDYQTPSMVDMVLLSQSITLPISSKRHTSDRSRCRSATTSSELCSQRSAAAVATTRPKMWVHRKSKRVR